MKLFTFIKEHSSRVPRKNFKEINGKEMWLHSLEKWDNLAHIMPYVDTDCDYLLKEIPKLTDNVCVYRRNPSLCGDKVGANALIQDYLERFELPDNEIIIQIHVTSPFLSVDTVMGAVDRWLIKGKQYDSVVSYHPIRERLWWLCDGGIPLPVNHDPRNLVPTQELNEGRTLACENCAFYIFTPASFRKAGHRMGLHPMFYEVPFPESLDIDTEEDLQICRAIAQWKKN